MKTEDPFFTEINPRECVELLRSQRVGRLAVVVDGRPEVFPVNYALDASDSVVFRTAIGTKIVAAVNHHVAFEVDRFDTDWAEGWSVVVHGVAQQTTTVSAGERQLVTWRPGATRLVRIVPGSVTGRRLHAPAGVPGP